MSKKSAGIVAYRFKATLEVLLVHPGGPFYKTKDIGVWSIPKGEYTDEDAPWQQLKENLQKKQET